MSNVGYATLGVIPSAKGFGSALDGQLAPGMRSSGTAGGALLGAGLVSSIAKFAAPLAAAFGIGKIFKTGFQEASDAAAGSAQLAAGIASTGNAAKVSVEGLNALASSIQLYSGQTDDSIVAAQGLLLTFTNIRNQGVDKIFDRATIASADMAARMGGDAAGSAKMLGKALNDPVAGVGALTKAGVQFTDSQKEQIATLVEAGDTLSAQKIILAELETQFGGSARAAGEAFPGQIEILKRSFEDFSQMLVARFLPSLGGGVTALSGVLQSATPVVDAALLRIGSGFSALMALMATGSFSAAFRDATGIEEDSPIVSFLLGLRDTAVSTFAGILAAVAPFVPTIVTAFSGLLPQVIALASSFSPLQLVFGALLPVLPQLAALVASLAAALGPLLGTALSVVTPIIGMLVELLSGTLADVLPVLATLLGVVGAAVLDLVPVFYGFSGALLELMSGQLSALLPILIDLATTVLPQVAEVFALVVTAIAPLVTMLAVLLIPIIEALLPVVKLVFEAVANIIESVMTIVQGVIEVVTGLISGNWDQVWTGILHVFEGIWNTLKAVLQLALSVIVGVLTGALDNASAAWNTAWSAISSFFSGIWEGLVNATASGISRVVSWFTGLSGQVLGALSGAGEWLVSTGQNMIDGLIKGVQQVAGKIAEAVLKPIRDSVEGVKSFLGIKSPSRLFMQIGGYTGEGMAIGLERSAGLVAKASEALIPTVPSFSSPDVVVGGVTGALAGVGTSGSGDNWTIEYNDHSTSSEDKQAKLIRAQNVLEQSVAARRGR